MLYSDFSRFFETAKLSEVAEKIYSSMLLEAEVPMGIGTYEERLFKVIHHYYVNHPEFSVLKEHIGSLEACIEEMTGAICIKECVSDEDLMKLVNGESFIFQDSAERYLPGNYSGVALIVYDGRRAMVVVDDPVDLPDLKMEFGAFTSPESGAKIDVDTEEFELCQLMNQEVKEAVANAFPYINIEDLPVLDFSSVCEFESEVLSHASKSFPSSP